MNKEIKQLMMQAIKQGWNVKVRNSGHMVWTSPNPKVGPIFSSQTPSDWRAIKKIKSQLRRAGASV